MRLMSLLLFSTLFAGCATYDSFDNSFDYGERNTTSVVLSAPNISAPHNPPIFVGVAYLEIYDKALFCERVPGVLGEKYNKGEPIGKMFANASQRQKEGEIPVGDVVVRAGFDARSFGSSQCDGYFSLATKAYRSYEVEVKESRPLLTHCYIAVKEKDLVGSPTEIDTFNSSKDRFFRSDDLSAVCGESPGDEPTED